MEQRALGTPGLGVSAIGLGCMGMSEFYGAADEAESLATLDAALERHGITFFDTADAYGSGANEELLSRFINGRRDRLVIATKFAIRRDPNDPTARIIDNSPAYIREAVDASLKRLRIDVIDLYYCHRVQPGVPIEETVGAMAELVATGKVRHLGLSEVQGSTLRRAHAVHPITAVQSEYSLWTRDAEQDVLTVCAELGIGFVAYSPLGRGFLAGSATNPEALDANDYRRANPRFVGEALDRNRHLADELKRIAAELGCTPAQLCIAWVLHQGPHIVPIPGTKRRTYLADNAAAAALRLSPEVLARLDATFAPGAAAGDRYLPTMMSLING